MSRRSGRERVVRLRSVVPSTRVLTLLIDVTLAIWGGELGGAKQEAGRPARSLP